MPLDVRTILSSIRDRSIPSNVIYLPEIDSTNRFLAELPTGHLHHGQVAITDYQSAGKGRQGRQWVAPPRSSLLLSVALNLASSAGPQDIVMLAALAVADAVHDITGLGPTIKWPNDVLLDGRKVAGVLAEVRTRCDGSFVILGIGLNVNLPFRQIQSLSPDATSLSIECGAHVDREALAVALFGRLDMWYRCLQQGPDTVFQTWKGRLDTLGKPVLVQDVKEVWQGLAVDVGRDGGLAVETHDGEVRLVHAADVSVRPAGGFTSTN